MIARKCPECGSELTVAVDPRQAGPTEIRGTWFNARCASCRFMFDYTEAD